MTEVIGLLTFDSDRKRQQMNNVNYVLSNVELCFQHIIQII